MKVWGLSLLVLLSISALAWQNDGDNAGKLVLPRYEKVATCQSRPEFLTRLRPDYLSQWELVQKHKLVAREVEFFAESTNREHIYAHHELEASKASRVICSTGQFKERLSLLAPVVIASDISNLWQFQVMSDGDRHSFWNVKSPQSLKSISDLKDFFRDQGVVTKIYRLSPKQYEILLTKKDKLGTQYVSIRYDAIEG